MRYRVGKRADINYFCTVSFRFCMDNGVLQHERSEGSATYHAIAKNPLGLNSNSDVLGEQECSGCKQAVLFHGQLT